MATPHIIPSVLTPFAAKGETWTYSDVAARSKRVLDRALDECTLKLNAVLGAPDAPLDLTEAKTGLRHLEALALKLGVSNEEATAELREVEGAFAHAKNAAREQHPDAVERTKEATQVIARIYARSRAVAALVHAIASQKAAQHRAKAEAKQRGVPPAKPAPAKQPAIKQAVVKAPPSERNGDDAVLDEPNGDGNGTAIGTNDAASDQEFLLRESDPSSSREIPTLTDDDLAMFLEEDTTPESPTAIGKDPTGKPPAKR